MTACPKKTSALVTRSCRYCGQSFQTYRRYLLRGKERGRYCSYQCGNAARQKQVTRTCKQCKSLFSVPVCRTANGKAKVCSRSCADKARRTGIERNCQNCQTPFMAQPSQAKHYRGANQYCSRKCSYAGQVIKNAVKPIRDRYGRSRRKADLEWQRAVRERDGFCCRRCGVYDPYIHTHHVAPRSRRPDLKHVVDNGMCLCNSCHTWCHHNSLEATALGFLSDAKYEAEAGLLAAGT